jgi:hypothetical protein
VRATGALAPSRLGRMPDESCIYRRREGKCSSRAALELGAVLGVDRAIGQLAGRQHGVVARWQLKRLGIGEAVIEGRIERGALHRLHQGVYAVGHRPTTTESRWMAAVLACGPDAVLSHRSAGQLWGIVPRSPIAPEVTRPRSFRPRPGVVCHRSPLRLDEIGEALRIPVTSVPRTVFDLAATRPAREVERALNEVEVQRLTDPLSLPELLERYPRRRGAATLRRLLGRTEPAGVTQLGLEELFLAFLDAHGFPRPLLNGTLPIRGQLLRPDCMWQRQRVIVELDGRAVHGTDRAFESDRRRDRILAAESWRSMRVTWLQLHEEPAAIAADLRQLLRGVAAPPTL